MKNVVKHVYMPHEQVRERTETATKRSARDYRGFRELARRTHPTLTQEQAEQELLLEHRSGVASAKADADAEYLRKVRGR